MKESTRGSFLRQSAWLSFATVFGGAFMTAVHTVAGQMATSQYEIFFAMLRLFLLLGIPSAGLQNAFARQTAAALDEVRLRELSSTIRQVLGAVFVLWLGMVVVAAFAFDSINTHLKLGDGRVIWPTLGVALLWLVIPVLRGALQGMEDFGTLGWVSILDGILRFAGMCLAVLGLHSGAVGAMTAAFLAMAASMGLAAWGSRRLWIHPGSGFRWGPWLGRVLPFTVGAGAMLALVNFDSVFLKAMIPADRAQEFLLGERYLPAAMIGFAMTQITVPLAMVMFPKIVRSSESGSQSNALTMAMLGTLGVGSVCVGFFTLFPKLPLQILFFRSPERWAAADLVPWCAWAMLAYAVANVLVSNLLAQERFGIVPWALGVALLFIGLLVGLQDHFLASPPLVAFREVAQIMAACNVILMLVAIQITRRRPQAA